jgi:hypothetical protein
LEARGKRRRKRGQVRREKDNVIESINQSSIYTKKENRANRMVNRIA